MSPVTVVVATNRTGVSLRRELALWPTRSGPSGLVNISFVTPFRLAQLLGEQVLLEEDRVPVSRVAIVEALERASHDLGVLPRGTHLHPKAHQRLVSGFREYRRRTASPSGKMQPLTVGDDTYIRAEEILKKAGFFDEEDLTLTALRVTMENSVAHNQLGSVVVYLPRNLSTSQETLLYELGRRSELVVVAGLHSIEGPDSTIRQVAQRIAPVERETSSGKNVFEGGVIDIFSTTDAEEEVREVLRVVVSALDEGVRADSIGVICAARSPYARILHEELALLGIATNGAGYERLSNSWAGRLLLGLLEWGSKGFSRRVFTESFADVPFHFQGHQAEFATWDLLSRELGVTAGAAELVTQARLFLEKLSGNQHSMELGSLRLLAHHRDRLSRGAEQLIAFVEWTEQCLEELSGLTYWREVAPWAERLLGHLLPIAGELVDGADRQARSIELVYPVLSHLSQLDALGLTLTPARAREYLRSELENTRSRVGSFGQGVFIGVVAESYGISFDRLCMVGLTDANFPGRPSSLSRGHLARGDGVGYALTHDPAEMAWSELCGLVAMSKQQTLGFPRGSLGSPTAPSPSRFLARIESLLPKATHLPNPARSLASAIYSLNHLTFPASPSEYRTAWFVRNTGRQSGGNPPWEAEEITQRALLVRQARKGPAPSEFDGIALIDDRFGDVDHPTSASALERWHRCPFEYFHRHLLHTHELNLPEATLILEPSIHGKIVHNAMEHLLRTMNPPSSEVLREESTALVRRLLDLGSDLYDQQIAEGRGGKRVFREPQRIKIRGELRRLFETLQERLSEEKGITLRPEVAFGSQSPFQYLLDDDEVYLKGQVDLLATLDDRIYFVADYKTGSPTGFHREPSAPRVGEALKFQMPIYAAAAKAILGGNPDADVVCLYLFSSIRAAESSRVMETLLNAATRGVFDENLRAVVREIRLGHFVPRAHQPSQRSCAYCEPHGLRLGLDSEALAQKLSTPGWEAYGRLFPFSASTLDEWASQDD